MTLQRLSTDHDAHAAMLEPDEGVHGAVEGGQGTEEENMKAQCMDGLGRCAYKGSHHDYVQNRVSPCPPSRVSCRLRFGLRSGLGIGC